MPKKSEIDIEVRITYLEPTETYLYRGRASFMYGGEHRFVIYQTSFGGYEKVKRELSKRVREFVAIMSKSAAVISKDFPKPPDETETIKVNL